MAEEEFKGETITIIADNDNALAKDFKPDEKVWIIVFKCYWIGMFILSLLKKK